MSTDTRTALIRSARPADGAAIARVHVDTWRDTYAGILPMAYLVDGVTSGVRLSSRRLGVQNVSGHQEVTLVAEVDEIVGYVSFGPARHVRDRAVGEIYALYILPDFQGCGLGRSLICVVLDRLFGAGKTAVDVEVLAANPARHFYTATGASVLGTGTHDFAGERLDVVYYRWQRSDTKA